MMSRRLQKVASLLKAEIAKIVTQELKDPGLGFVTITEVRPSPDLRLARVYVSAIGDQEAQRNTLKALQRARKFIQEETSKRVTLRNLPVLSFRLDDRVKRSIRISKLLSDIQEEKDVDRQGA